MLLGEKIRDVCAINSCPKDIRCINIEQQLVFSLHNTKVFFFIHSQQVGSVEDINEESLSLFHLIEPKIGEMSN